MSRRYALCEGRIQPWNLSGGDPPGANHFQAAGAVLAESEGDAIVPLRALR